MADIQLRDLPASPVTLLNAAGAALCFTVVGMVIAGGLLASAPWSILAFAVAAAMLALGLGNLVLVDRALREVAG